MRTRGTASVSPEPVAVIGVGCRFPGGVDSLDAFWRLLCAGRPRTPGRGRQHHEDAPQQAAASRGVTGRGGLLAAAGCADAELFGLSPRAAALVEPQERILLEVAREALDHAAVAPSDLVGTDTGVFLGICTGDDGDQLLDDLSGSGAGTGTGAATRAAADRISRSLGLRGASMAVDAACSTSLVALHLAVKSLRTGTSHLALAGGVDLITAPGAAPTAEATGASRPAGAAVSDGCGEGGGVVVLKRLSDAERDGDRVLAVIGGSAVGQGARTTAGPGTRGGVRQHVLTRACQLAGIAPSTVGYVEAHGAGTRVGAPSGTAELRAVFGDRSAEQPCLIGSVECQLGQLEGAAGIAGLITTVLALLHAEIPPGLLRAVGSAADREGAGPRTATGRTPWPEGAHPRRAGVSSFGYGGTVAHLVLEQAPPQRAWRCPAGPAREVPDGDRGNRRSAQTVLVQHGKDVHGALQSGHDRLRPLPGPARPGARPALPLLRAHDPRQPRHAVPAPPA